MKNYRYVSLLLVALLTSCQTFTPSKESKSALAADAIKEAQQQKASQNSVSTDEVLDSLIPPITLEAAELDEERFDVSVKNIDARSFLLSLVDSTPFNMVVSPDLETKISLQLKNVTISEVLKSVERIYPLMVERQDNIFYVSSAESMTVVYPVDYINLSRKGRSRTNVAGQAVASGQSGNNRQSGTQQSGSNRSSSVSQINSSEIETESKTDFWQELNDSLKLIIRDEEKANVIVSPHAGVVIIKALPNTQRLISEYLGVSQQNLNRQVVLEAKIIEVKLNEGFQSGIDWNKIYSVNNGDSLQFGQQGQTLKTPYSDTPLNGIFSMLYQSTSFNAAIDLLKNQGDVQVLSSPRVSTVNNQKAVIKVGSDEFFVTDVSTTTVTGTSTATTPDVTLTPFFSGISLDVTPQINQQGEIILHIHPVVSEVDDQQKTITLGKDQFTLPLALSNVRESDSVVRSKDQQVIVIGGLMQNKVDTAKHSTPLLGDVPVLGKLFQQNRESNVKSELVILLKASLVNDGFYQKELKAIQKRFERL